MLITQIYNIIHCVSTTVRTYLTSSNTFVITYYCFVFQKKILDFKKGDEKKVAEAEA